MKDMLGKIGGFALLAGIFFGLFAVVFVPIEMIKKADAETWPVRKGVITTSYASHHRGSAGKHGSGPYWTAEICGTYLDNGERFCVDRIRYGGFRFGEGKADVDETLAKYPVGREVDVHYDSEDPKDTVLEARSRWIEMYVLLGLGFGFLLLPVLLWLFRKQIDPEQYGR